MTNKPHILIADDDNYLVDLMKLVFQGAGFDVASASNGREAMALVRDNDFDLIVLDMRMPEMDGIGFLKWFRFTHESTRNTPVFVLTAENQERMADIKEAGADSICQKPIDAHDLLVRVQQLLTN